MLWVRFPAMPDAQNIDIVVLDFVANFVSINQQTADFARVKAKQYADVPAAFAARAPIFARPFIASGELQPPLQHHLL